MKSIKNIQPDFEKDGEKYYSLSTLKEITVQNIKQILSHTPEVSPSDVMACGVIETGELQFSVPKSISSIGTVKMLGYTRYFLDLNEGDFK
jgi:hypothetical protein